MENPSADRVENPLAGLAAFPLADLVDPVELAGRLARLRHLLRAQARARAQEAALSIALIFRRRLVNTHASNKQAGANAMNPGCKVIAY